MILSPPVPAWQRPNPTRMKLAAIDDAYVDRWANMVVTSFDYEVLSAWSGTGFA